MSGIRRSAAALGRAVGWASIPVAVLLALIAQPLPALLVLGGSSLVDGLRDARHVAAGPLDRLVGGWARPATRLLAAAAVGPVLWENGVQVVAVVALAILLLMSAVVDGVDGRVAGLRLHPVARGIPGLEPISGLGRAPTLWRTTLPELLVGAAAVSWPARPAAVGGVAVVAVGTGGLVSALWVLRVRRGRADRARRLGAAQDALDRLRPEVVLYCGDGASSVHEVAMWLAPLERLSVPALVLARDRDAFDALPSTTTPVLCVPGATDLQCLAWDPVRVALFVSNIGNNLHLLRVRGLRSAFIGHGDSDKGASSNPYSKVYDEIWVAGSAGRERYLRAGVGVAPEALVEVGRPQLDLVAQRTAHGPQIPTLLYAPTWEGWGDETNHSSLADQGELLVRTVLAHPRPVRLMYRPHPYTGRRSAAAASAHQRVVELLEAANAAEGLPDPVLPAAAASTAGSAAGRERDEVASGERRLAGLSARAHLVVPPGAAPLIACLNAVDGLVTDVSSVLSDALAGDKPVAVCDPRDLGVELFVDRYPVAAAGPVLGAGLDALPRFLEVLTGSAPDEWVERRRAVRQRVLGPVLPPAQERFRAAVAALAQRAECSVPTDPHGVVRAAK